MNEFKFDTSVECSFIAKSGWLDLELCFQTHQVSGSSALLSPLSHCYTSVRDVQRVRSTKQFLEFPIACYSRNSKIHEQLYFGASLSLIIVRMVKTVNRRKLKIHEQLYFRPSLSLIIVRIIRMVKTVNRRKFVIICKNENCKFKIRE